MRKAEVTSHIIRFRNGGVFHYRYRDDGIIEKLSGGPWITITVTPENRIVVQEDHTHGSGRLLTLSSWAADSPECDGPRSCGVGPSFQISPAGTLDITIPEPLDALSIANLAEVVSHEITQEAGATLHLIGFRNGGIFSLLWTDEGEIKELSGQGVAGQFTEDHQLLLWGMPVEATGGSAVEQSL